jgi:hypothetical protein
MPKQPRKEPKESLEDRIVSWLKTEGFPFELRVGRTLRGCGWDITHGKIYADPVAGTLRELDVVARVLRTMSSPMASAALHLAVSCKSQSNLPWVVFSTDVDEASWPTPVHASRRDERYVVESAARDLHNAGEDLETFAVSRRQAHSAVRAFKGNGADSASGRSPSGDSTSAYAAVQAVAGATLALEQEFHEIFSERGMFPTIPMVLPVIAIEAPLFEFFLDEKHEQQLRRVPMAKLVTTAPTSAQEAMLVRIVQSEYLDEFACLAFRDAMRLVPAVLSRAHELIPTNLDGIVGESEAARAARARY